MRKLGHVTSFIAITAASSSPALAQSDPFDAVWDVITQPAAPDSPGCRGCHVGEEENPPAPYWGNDRDQVRDSIVFSGYVEGGRDSYLAARLRSSDPAFQMPRDGRPWNDDELAILDAWLVTFESDPFDAVWEIMTQPAAPDSPGCRGCHVGEEENPPAPYWGNDKDQVRDSIVFSGYVEGGRDSYLAARLRSSDPPFQMPRDGRSWNDDELAVLDAWLITFEAAAGQKR